MEEQLIRLYNSMTLISTKGEDTLVMSQCLIALQQIIKELQQKDKEE